MNTFIESVERELNKTTTANGDKAFRSTMNKCLDFFFFGGVMQNSTESEQVKIFRNAYLEDPEVAVKLMFYFRDVRGGHGVRSAFRNQIRWLAEKNPECVIKNLHLVPEYGRWDDLFSLLGTKVESNVFDLIKFQLEKDKTSDNPSLLAKWLKSENASSKESRRIARKTAKVLGMTSKEYRKMLSGLREKIRVVERDMSARKWKKIDYSSVPGRAMMIYRNAFLRNDRVRFNKFVNAVLDGKAKINSSTVYPYELVERSGGIPDMDAKDEDSVIDAQWNSLPDFIGSDSSNTIAVVDVSQSMFGRPLIVAVSLGLYLAERLNGAFKDKFITFSSYPELVTVTGDTLREKVTNMVYSDWGMDTNLESVYKLMLNAALDESVSDEDMPKRIIILSDMQFNQCVEGDDKSVFEEYKRKFAEAGYTMPSIVFWNVASAKTVPVEFNENGVQLVSGFSPSLYETILKSEGLTPLDLMMKIAYSERYAKVWL